MLPFASDIGVKNMLPVVMKRPRKKSRPFEEIAVGGGQWSVTWSVKHWNVGNKELNLCTMGKEDLSVLGCSKLHSFKRQLYVPFGAQVEYANWWLLHKILCIQNRMPACIPFSFEHSALIWPTKWIGLNIECTYQTMEWRLTRYSNL